MVTEKNITSIDISTEVYKDGQFILTSQQSKYFMLKILYMVPTGVLYKTSIIVAFGT